MRCISVQQIVRSNIQAERKILQQLNRAAAASRFNFCKMVRTNVQHYTQLFLCNPLLFPQIADSNLTLFHKSEFAHKLPQSIFSVKSFFCGGTWQIHTTNSQEWISALELHIFHYKLVSKTSICLSLQRKHIKFSTFFTGLIFTIQRKKLNAVSI